MKKFRTWYDTKIEEVEAIRETAKFVTIQEGTWSPRKSLKHPDQADDMHYHDSWQEAKDFLIDRKKTAICKLRGEIKTHQVTLQKIEEMTQP